MAQILYFNVTIRITKLLFKPFLWHSKQNFRDIDMQFLLYSVLYDIRNHTVNLLFFQSVSSSSYYCMVRPTIFTGLKFDGQDQDKTHKHTLLVHSVSLVSDVSSAM